ncbi:50S ribosomal protein L17 [Candidatus Peregrinibacteria bacterium]|nr:50S ribosomal protein L17 [Candidatus Peregrinibacteria bacterium]
MRHNVKKLYLGLPKGQRKLLMYNLATSLILEEKIKTTKAKAKALQGIMDKLINDAKHADKKTAIRKVSSLVQSEICSKKLVDEITKRYQDRNSGYTRISDMGFRAGDAAPIVQIELV